MKIHPLLICLFFLLSVLPAQAAERILVTEFYDNTVDLYPAGLTPQTETALDVGVSPIRIVASPDGTRLYVANYTTADLSVIDSASLRVTDRIELACRPSTLAISPDGTSAYAVCRSVGKIAPIDLTTNSATDLTDLIPVTFPQEIALGPQGKMAYVSRTFFSHYLYVVDLEQRRVIDSITVGRAPKGVVLSPDGQHVYVANAGSASISVIDSASRQVVQTITVGPAPNTLAIDRQGHFLYVAHDRENRVSVVDLRTGAVMASIEVGIKPQRMALAGDNSKLYVANFDSNTVSVIDTTRQAVLTSFTTGNGPSDVLLLKELDTSPPSLALTSNTEILWPPNHKFRDVHLQVNATDDQDPAPKIRLVSIVSNEPCLAVTTGEKRQPNLNNAAPQSCNDIAGAEFGTADVDFKLRAERFTSDGVERVYTITYEATDAANNRTTAALEIHVPLSMAAGI